MKIDRLIMEMSLIDESIGRLFLAATPLHESFEVSVDLSDLVGKFDRYVDKFFSEADDRDVDLEYIEREANWSLQQVLRFLKLLVPTNAQHENLVVKNPRETMKVCLAYKNILEKLLSRVKDLK